MYSDTHFHFNLIVNDRGENGTDILSKMAENHCFFAQDIGTSYDDLSVRQHLVETITDKIPEREIRDAVFKFMHFSAGIWPSPDEIRDRIRRFPIFRKQLTDALTSDEPFFRKVTAIGECGLDHHWNPAGADGRSEEDFDDKMIKGERELFCMQLELAKEMKLPVIIHSRDAAEETIDCIRECGYHNGVIHCYSYGIEEARTFLDMGWYISFTGSVTYTKKSKMDAMSELLRFIPDDRILLETDAPYLAPVPFRGKTNTPLLVEYVHKFIAEIRGVSAQYLSDIADKNAAALFL